MNLIHRRKNKTLTVWIIEIVLVSLGPLGFILFRYLNSPIRYHKYIEQCVNNYDLEYKQCEKFVISAHNDEKKNFMPEPDEAKGTKDYVEYCTNKKMPIDFCECAFETIKDQYGYDGYVKYQVEVRKSFLSGTKNLQFREHLDLLSEIPSRCNYTKN